MALGGWRCVLDLICWCNEVCGHLLSDSCSSLLEVSQVFRGFRFWCHLILLFLVCIHRLWKALHLHLYWRCGYLLLQWTLLLLWIWDWKVSGNGNRKRKNDDKSWGEYFTLLRNRGKELENRKLPSSISDRATNFG